MRIKKKRGASAFILWFLGFDGKPASQGVYPLTEAMMMMGGGCVDATVQCVRQPKQTLPSAVHVRASACVCRHVLGLI